MGNPTIAEERASDLFRKPAGKTLQAMTLEVEENNKSKGWYDEERTFGEDVALLHSEVSEALEAYRTWGLLPVTAQDHKPVDVGSELADVLIRLLDMAKRYGFDLEVEYERKMDFNRTRPYRHGGKKL